MLARDAVLRRTLALSDVVAAYMALLFAVLVVGAGAVHLRAATALLAPLVVVISKAIGLYDRDQHLLRKTTTDELPLIFNLAVLYTLSVWLAEALLFRGWLGRAEVFGLAAASVAFIAVGRLLVRAIVPALTAAERCIVVGDANDAARIADKFATSRGVNATVIGRVALRAHENGSSSGSAKLGDLGSLERVIFEHHVERVIVAPNGDVQDAVLEVVRLVNVLGVRMSVLPRLLDVVGSSSVFDDLDGITLLGMRQYGLSKSSQFLKRSIDIVGATIILVLLAPLMVALAIAIRLDSLGSTFFHQPRIGRGGERFSMIKFRSMVENADQIKAELRARNEAEGGLFKISDDPRITRVGRFLRQASLDELPQLLNVLKGHMSLVGPRPLVPDEDALIEGWRRRRLAVKPGMTGLWQIFGSSRIPMSEMVKIDYLYGANWSIWGDMKILLRTVPYVLGRRGV
jgi:exopolysaccharide biosynthesis polyprenyl glycosylphosphotransferase